MDAMKKSRCVYVLLCFLKSALTARLPVQTGSICTSGKFKLEEWVWRRKKKFFLVLQRNTKLRGQINKSVNSVAFSFCRLVDLNDRKECLQKATAQVSVSDRFPTLSSLTAEHQQCDQSSSPPTGSFTKTIQHQTQGTRTSQSDKHDAHFTNRHSTAGALSSPRLPASL